MRRIQVTDAAQARAYAEELLGHPGPGAFAAADQPPARHVVVERGRLHWCKITDPHAAVPVRPAGVDVRVLLPLAPEFAGLCTRLAAAGVPYRQVRYWLEAETVSTVDERGRLLPLRVTAELPRTAGAAGHRTSPVLGWPAEAARDAFQMLWDSHAEPPDQGWQPVKAGELVPEEWLPYLPYPTLNPAQVEAAPAVLGSGQHLVVTAPTGAGKTVIGMLAALKANHDERRKAAWLVPQRSLTDELDRELGTWRKLGLRVERLSGEYAIDAQKVREADLWVATTEKFEAICRTASMRDALSEVGCLVVDEIHLLGDPTRGPLLEALLARVRGDDSPVRIVGLSATAANADQVATWLGARLVRIAWRPSRLTWQLPLIPANGDWTVQQAGRTRQVTAITSMITQDGGSVLVFCGSKRNVRATALAIAADRGADARGTDPDDVGRVHRICASVGVGLHYKDWEHKHEAERGFRDRELDVLVATSTVAAGVNLPARAVVIRDTQIGLSELDVATVQQMFGRAGRIGHGETEGWAYLITDETERTQWQARLVEGYSIESHIADSLADHILAETVQGRIHTAADAETWWMSTLAYHQGTHDLAPVHSAITYLIQGGYLDAAPGPDGTTTLTVTELGTLTTRIMVPVVVGTRLRAALAGEPVPTDPADAEEILGRAVATLVPQLAEAPINDDMRPVITRLLRTRGGIDREPTASEHRRPTLPTKHDVLARLRAEEQRAGVQQRGGEQMSPEPGPDLGPAPPSGLGSPDTAAAPGSDTAPGQAPAAGYEPGDLAQVAFALVAGRPGLFARYRRTIANLPATRLYPILEEAPRYFAWLGAQGNLGTVHPWVAVVAADLGRRIRWRRQAPPRGSGRLLWICEQMATPLHATTAVPDLFAAARAKDVADPDWPAGRTPPRQCKLDGPRYLALLRDRATGTTFTDIDGQLTVTCPNGATVAVWTGQNVQISRSTTAAAFSHPAAPGTSEPYGATVFTRRGDSLSHGWLSTYNTIRDQPHEP